jgi:AcrR family transcriptional regulator
MKDFTNNKKYIAIMLASSSLFWKYGFRRVTIDEICREAKTSKMTFYSFFPNKLELAKAVFDKEANEGLRKFREILKEDILPAEKLKKILQLKIDGTNDISSEFLNDFYNNPELGLTTYIEEKSRKIWAETLELFKEGQKEGWIRKDMKVEFMFYFMQKSTPLVTDKELLKLYYSPQELIVELANMFLYGISPARE